MSCGAGFYQLTLTCNDSDLDEVFVGEWYDSYGLLCAAVCATIDTGDGYKVKVNFPGGYWCDSGWYNVCKDGSTYYVCLPDDCCTVCDDCCDYLEDVLDNPQIRVTFPASCSLNIGGPGCNNVTGTYDLTMENPANSGYGCILHYNLYGTLGLDSMSIRFCAHCDGDADGAEDERGIEISVYIDNNSVPCYNENYGTYVMCNVFGCTDLTGSETTPDGILIEWDLVGGFS